MSSGVMVARKRYITSRQVQKLSSSGPRRSTRPAMARWKAWLWTLATPGTATPAKRWLLAVGVLSGATAVMVRPATVIRDVAPPSVADERARHMDLCHGSPALVALMLCRSALRTPSRYV